MHKTKKISALPALIAVLALIVCALVVGVFADGGEAEEAVSRFYGTAWSLLPPVIAIVLALITKEVYSSLFVGILIFLVIVIIVIFRLINGKLDQHSHKGEPNGKNNSKRNFLHFCQLGSRKAT